MSGKISEVSPWSQVFCFHPKYCSYCSWWEILTDEESSGWVTTVLQLSEITWTHWKCLVGRNKQVNNNNNFYFTPLRRTIWTVLWLSITLTSDRVTLINSLRVNIEILLLVNKSRIGCGIIVLRLDLEDLHTLQIWVKPSRDVDPVQAGEVHPVAALVLPVHWPRVRGEDVQDRLPQLSLWPQPLTAGHVDVGEVGLRSVGEYDAEFVWLVSDPAGTVNTWSRWSSWNTGTILSVSGLRTVVLRYVGLDVEDGSAVHHVDPGEVESVLLHPVQPGQGEADVGRSVRGPEREPVERTGGASPACCWTQ